MPDLVRRHTDEIHLTGRDAIVRVEIEGKRRTELNRGIRIKKLPPAQSL